MPDKYCFSCNGVGVIGGTPCSDCTETERAAYNGAAVRAATIRDCQRAILEHFNTAPMNHDKLFELIFNDFGLKP